MLAELQSDFGLHDLAIEDAYTAHQRPKLEIYGETLFVVMKTAQLVGDDVAMGETCIFVGRGYVITVRHGASRSYAEVRARCENSPKMLRQGEDFILYALMDFIVDNYFPIVDDLEERIEELEESLSQPASTRETIEPRSRVRRELLKSAPRGGAAARDLPAPDALRRAGHRPRHSHPYFRDVLRPLRHAARPHRARCAKV